jgi:hypothetical protein
MCSPRIANVLLALAAVACHHDNASPVPSGRAGAREPIACSDVPLTVHGVYAPSVGPRRR